MGDVYANGLEISGKAVQAQTIAAFPDVCMTPPENPATPPGVPVPYPNFAMAGDTENGTSTVFIGGKTVNLKNKSDMSRTSGDEAGCAAKKGVITSRNTGKSYFNSWSPNVKFEGEPVVRFSDLTTNNHASPAANTPPWVHVAKLHLGRPLTAAEKKCPPMGPFNKVKCKKGSHAHHIVPDMCYRTGTRGSTGGRMPGAPSLNQGMCVCLTHKQHSGLHSSLNADLKKLGARPMAVAGGKRSVPGTAPMSKIKAKCAQSIKSVPNLSPTCKKLAVAMAAKQVKDAKIASRPGRTTTSLPSGKARTVIRRGRY
ncbi:DUF4150 domain-containing protein [Rhodovulum steppense]|uniref:Uncharacterized protein DUF4150 n=1 Tax=Rhodovulum steppense TaxID=540251 RepID=A0A4V2R4X9_9RHOB|nr:DUF4150 domain-containing protein [Rhodovulum steppense]TCM86474.1 uncharacterized protein DUF4150 [Rhodovulum steppense]